VQPGDLVVPLEADIGSVVSADCQLAVAGRKLEDDVIDITYQVLTGKAGVGDGVPYTRPAAGPGSTNPAIGHKPLIASFPFLAPPN